MGVKIPKRLINSKYRRELWRQSQKTIRKLARVLPISEIYLRGSFTTQKKRPADVDFIILLKTKTRNHREKWSVDFVVVPDNAYGNFILEDAGKWMRQKYGTKKSAFLKLK